MSAPAFPSTVDALVRRSAARVPDRVALHFGARAWTYRALDDATSRVAAALLGLGLQRGDRVAGLGKNSDAFLLLYLGCARAGLVHVPVNYNVAGAELAYLVAQPGCAALLHDPAFAAAVDAVAGELPIRVRGTLRDGADPALDVLAWATADGAVPEVEAGVADDDLVQLLFTSGTTSAPKGAMMTHRALLHEYVSCITALG